MSTDPTTTTVREDVAEAIRILERLSGADAPVGAAAGRALAAMTAMARTAFPGLAEPAGSVGRN